MWKIKSQEFSKYFLRFAYLAEQQKSCKGQQRNMRHACSGVEEEWKDERKLLKCPDFYIFRHLYKVTFV